MMVAVRCFTCGKVIGHLWEEYNKRVEDGEEGGKVLTELGLDRYCCRQMLMSNVDMMKDLNQFKT